MDLLQGDSLLNDLRVQANDNPQSLQDAIAYKYYLDNSKLVFENIQETFFLLINAYRKLFTNDDNLEAGLELIRIVAEYKQFESYYYSIDSDSQKQLKSEYGIKPFISSKEIENINLNVAFKLLQENYCEKDVTYYGDLLNPEHELYASNYCP